MTFPLAQIIFNHAINYFKEKMMFNHFSHNDSKLLEEYLSCKKRMEEIEKSLIKQNECITSLDFKVFNFLSKVI